LANAEEEAADVNEEDVGDGHRRGEGERRLRDGAARCIDSFQLRERRFEQIFGVRNGFEDLQKILEFWAKQRFEAELERFCFAVDRAASLR
jgi:hypothetical protein